MKANKMITLDVDLLKSLNELELNVSEFCNEKLWTYVTAMENKQEEYQEQEKDIEKELIELEAKKLAIQKAKYKKEHMEAAGITNEKIKFLENMGTNIGNAKDAKFSWLRKFNESVDWNELRELKAEWAE